MDHLKKRHLLHLYDSDTIKTHSSKIDDISKKILEENNGMIDKVLEFGSKIPYSWKKIYHKKYMIEERDI